MAGKGMTRFATLALAAAALWAAPMTGAQARYHHGDPPRQAPQDGSNPQSQESRPEATSPGANRAPEDCFRHYNDRCDRARNDYRGHRDGPAY